MLVVIVPNYRFNELEVITGLLVSSEAYSHSASLSCLCWHVCGRFSSRNFYIQHRKTCTHTDMGQGDLREEVRGFSSTQLLGMARDARAFIKWSHGAWGFGIPQAGLSL